MYVHIIMYSQICFFKVLIKGTYYWVLVIWSAGILGLKSSVESWSTYTCKHVKTLTRTIFIVKGLYDCLYSKQWILYTKIESGYVYDYVINSYYLIWVAIEGLVWCVCTFYSTHVCIRRNTYSLSPHVSTHLCHTCVL